MTSRLSETDFRDALAYLKAVLTWDDQGARCVAAYADPGRVLDAMTTLCIPGRINRDDPLAWTNQMFADLDGLLAGSAVRRTAKRRQVDETSSVVPTTPTLTPPALPGPTPPPTTSLHRPPLRPTRTTMTITSTLNPADQFTALAKVRTFDLDNLARARSQFSVGYGGTSLRELVSLLRQAGIEPSEAARHDELIANDLPKPPEPAGRRLDQTPDEYQSRIREVALFRAARIEGTKFVAVEREVLTKELRRSMQAEVEDYLDQLRPQFDTAIKSFRAATDLGLTVNSTPEQAMTMGADAVAVWMSMTTGASATQVLDGIAYIRIRISTALGVQPCNREVHGDQANPVHYGIAFGVGREFDRFTGWQRWLGIAQTGTAALRSIAEVDSIVNDQQRVDLRVPVPISPTSDQRPGIVDSDPPTPSPDDLATAGF